MASKDKYFLDYLETQQRVIVELKDTQNKIAEHDVKHDAFVREHMVKAIEQHNSILGRLNDYHKLLVYLIGLLAAVLGIKAFTGGGL